MVYIPEQPTHGALSWDTYVKSADTALDTALDVHETKTTDAHGGIVSAEDALSFATQTQLAAAIALAVANF